MKKWKSLLAVTAIATMVFAMAACGDKDTAADPTEAPNPTEAPADPTEAPADPTEAPADPTEEPAPTEEPVVEPTEEPAPTEEPVVEPTVAPTEAPVATEAPKATATPAPTATPVPTEAPTPTEAPEPTPEPTATPAPTATPEPVVEDNPWAFDFTDDLGAFEQRGSVVLEIVDGALYATERTANWHGPAVNCANLGVDAAGKTVSVTFKAKSGEAGEIEVKCTCDQDSSAWNQLAQGTVGNEWVELSGSFEVPAGVGTTVIYFESAGDTEKFYIDDVVFDFK